LGQRTTKPSTSNGGRGSSFLNYKRIAFKDLFSAKMFDEITAANIALPKLGQDIGTFTAAMWQLQLWAGLVLISFTFYLNFKFSIYHFHRAGQSLNIPTSAMHTVVCNGGRTEEQSQA
jgi:hypothetical protein